MKESNTIKRKCLFCGKDFIVKKAVIKTAKYCSRVCSDKSQKGKKNPHSKEWEENRLAAVKKSLENKVWPKGYSRPKEHTVGMVNAAERFRRSNPEKSREISLRNLSKNKTLSVSKENSPNWRGGITSKSTRWRNENKKKFSDFNNKVLTRDGHKCKLCGSKEKVCVHHIVSVSSCKKIAFLPMNGVTLCYDCHKKTDNFGGGARVSKTLDESGNLKVIMATIQHKFHAYETLGDYQWTDDGILVIFISELGNDDYEFLLMIHEYTEANLAKKSGIKEEDITRFDIEFEKTNFNNEEPGDQRSAPYYKQHQQATKIERELAKMLGVNWEKYENHLNRISDGK